MDEHAKSLYYAIGALSEMCGILYKGLIQQGFTESQALELTKVFLASQIAAIQRPQPPQSPPAEGDS